VIWHRQPANHRGRAADDPPGRSVEGLDRFAGLGHKDSMSEEKIVEVVNEALAAAGLPERMVVGVSETTVYGFAGNRARPQALLFRPGSGLQP
jgi:hypothetical protein